MSTMKQNILKAVIEGIFETRMNPGWSVVVGERDNTVEVISPLGTEFVLTISIEEKE